ncbi:PH domain-containing protein [Montanilutibacter psychrotolerans]|uniref:YdbS-like PH domain-containing protein n=1 Tax=Montanilutibacter psychrotolerans TaxID=1327343 RepID=A0A3M8SYR1_9GAMM|nr:PH domain-containing protein [Lysobacter psychrotolerans]RNF84576.1 hypothetical protein EER27_08995 [Lysobacter psychrotolerans]
MSWLFVLLQQLRQFVIPLLALLVFGRGDRNELWPLIGVGALVLLSVWSYFTYRYGVTADSLVVRSGLLERSLRVIPFARIHNVAVQQSLLHRLFGVAEVRLESAGGTKPEAEMRVLKYADAIALEALVRHRGLQVAPSQAESANEPSPVLLAMSTAEVLRHGLVSNRGMVVLGAGAAALAQFSPKLMPQMLKRWGEALFGYGDSHGYGIPDYVLVGLSLAVLLVVVLRLFSMVLALLQYHGFRLVEHGRRLTVERGLLARWRTSASRRRIQAWTLRESQMHRLLRRRSLEIDTAAREEGNGQQRALRELAPIATPDACDALIEHLLPRAGWAALDWRALPASNWWRLFAPHLPWLLLATGLLCLRVGSWGLLALLWLPWAVLLSRQQARRMAWACNAELVAVRGGWWSRHWRFAEIDKLQALRLSRSPLDRRCGTATLSLDTAGSGAMAPPLQIRFLPEAQAQALYARLAHELAKRPLRW